MSKLVVLKFRGTFSEGFEIELDIRSEGGDFLLEGQLGTLPPISSSLEKQLAIWQSIYRKLSKRSRKIKPIQIEIDGTLDSWRDRLRSESKKLSETFNRWLTDSIEFHPIDSCLRDNLQLEESIRILLRSEDRELHNLPWNQWIFLEQYTKAEIAFAPRLARRRSSVEKVSSSPSNKVKILSVLGHSDDIDISVDKDLLKQLPNVDIHFLEDSDRKTFSDTLRKSDWQILFFAGHSETDEIGIIRLNGKDILSLKDLKSGLRNAIDQGMQLAIFNSCNGLGLAYDLSELSIPTVVVMREPVPDQVAQIFLQYFLEKFSQGTSLFESARQAREQLEGIEDRFPCASWLPVIWQNPTTDTFVWPTKVVPSQFSSTFEPKSAFASESTFNRYRYQRTAKPRKLWQSLIAVLILSLLASGLVIEIQSLGWLQTSELAIYNRLMQSRPIEQPDNRLLIVGADEGDLDEYLDDRGARIPDEILAKVLEKISQHEPKVIGLDIFRPNAVPPGHDALVKQLESNDKIITPCFLSASNVENSIAPPIASPESNIGFIDLYNDDDLDSSDPTLRRYLLSKSSNPQDVPSRCKSDYSFAILLVDKYLQAENKEVKVDESEKNWVFDTLIVPPINSQSGGYARFDDRGYQILINYRQTADPRTIAQQINFRSILNDDDSFDVKWIKDRVVIVGITAKSRHDEHHTPFGNISGPIIHGHVVSQFLSAFEDNRPLISWLPQWQEYVWLTFWAILSGSLIHLFHNLFVRGGICFAVVITIWKLNGLFFNHAGIWIPTSSIILVCLINGIFVLFYNEWKKPR